MNSSTSPLNETNENFTKDDNDTIFPPEWEHIPPPAGGFSMPINLPYFGVVSEVLFGVVLIVLWMLYKKLSAGKQTTFRGSISNHENAIDEEIENQNPEFSGEASARNVKAGSVSKRMSVVAAIKSVGASVKRMSGTPGSKKAHAAQSSKKVNVAPSTAKMNVAPSTAKVNVAPSSGMVNVTSDLGKSKGMLDFFSRNTSKTNDEYGDDESWASAEMDNEGNARNTHYSQSKNNKKLKSPKSGPSLKALAKSVYSAHPKSAYSTPTHQKYSTPAGISTPAGAKSVVPSKPVISIAGGQDEVVPKVAASKSVVRAKSGRKAGVSGRPRAKSGVSKVIPSKSAFSVPGIDVSRTGVPKAGISTVAGSKLTIGGAKSAVGTKSAVSKTSKSMIGKGLATSKSGTKLPPAKAEIVEFKKAMEDKVFQDVLNKQKKAALKKASKMAKKKSATKT